MELGLLAGVAVILIRRGSLRKGQGTRQECPVTILEYSLVLLLMVLLSPMSSKPHFSTLVLPGFALARLAVYRGDKILQLLLSFAVVFATLSLPLWGGRLDFIALWFGSDTWNALVLLLGTIYILTSRKQFSSPLVGSSPRDSVESKKEVT